MSKSANNDIMVAISVPPFWHCGRTIRGNSIYTLIALAPAMLAAFAIWGIPAIRVVALSVFTAMACEFLCQKAMGQKPSQSDGTAVVLGVLFAFLLPAAAPWWLVVIGVGCAMCLGRMAFGGYGTNPVSAVLVGWALVFVSFPTYMDATSTILLTDLCDPLLRLKQFGPAAVADMSYADLLLGLQLGGLGAAQVGLLCLGGLFIILRGVIRWEVPLCFLLGVAVTAACFQFADSARYAGPLFHLCSGTTVLAAFFLATEDSCSPHRRLPMCLYGLTGGALVVIIRIFGIYTDGAPFAVMLINLLAPMFGLVVTRPFGWKKGDK